MIFEILAEKESHDKRTFFYDNVENILKTDDGTIFEFPEIKEQEFEEYKSFDKNNPLKKSKLIHVLKIQLGLSCNYSCEYCSQRFVERAPETNKKDIDAFMQKLSVLEFDENTGLKIEFWGGEPLVYWKTLKPLVDEVNKKFESWQKKPEYSIITNGSLLTEEVIQWLIDNKFSVSVSHDGPGQSVRGPDPFEDLELKERVLNFYRYSRANNLGFSFNPMLHVKNKSRKEIYDWFVEFTGDPNVILGEGGIVDAYDEDGSNNSLQTLSEHFEFRRKNFIDLYSTDGYIGFLGQLNKINQFVVDLLSHKKSKYLGQKCGMDDEHVIAVDLRGNVITCQNVSAVETGMNGESHLGGSLDDYENVAIKTGTHWSNRPDCASCPVLHVCKGSCLFLQDKYWNVSCNNAYSDNIVHFALAFAKITNGYIPTFIKNEHLPDERKDIFGTILQHKDKPRAKTIPIKVVSEIVTKIDDVPVYGKSELKV
jgi:uncharacterized protein